MIKSKFLIIFILLNSFYCILFSKEYINQLNPGLILTYQHWNKEHSKITGYTYQEYKLVTIEGNRNILETQLNVKINGVQTRKKTILYELPYGIPKKYLEEDLLEEIKITNKYLEGIIFTELIHKDKKVNFQMKLNEENTVSFEILLQFLRKNFKRIYKEKNFKFTLYVPALAIELKENGLPLSMSLLDMQINSKDNIIWNSKLGNKKANWIEIFPESLMLRTILPKSKSHFRFLIEINFPHHILQFEEGGNVYKLVDRNKMN